MKTCFSLAVAALLCAGGPARSAEVPQATRAALTEALKAFLARHGDICLAKYAWPIDVSARDVAARTRDALQMPALQAQGLVKASDGYVIFKTDEAEDKVPTRRYELTALGQRFYKAHETVSHAGGGQSVVHHADLCAGHLELDTIVKVTLPAASAGAPGSASVSYRYHFTPEAWVDNPPIRRVFPMLDMLIQGQGTQEMTQRFHREGSQWAADSAID